MRCANRPECENEEEQTCVVMRCILADLNVRMKKRRHVNEVYASRPECEDEEEQKCE